MNVVQMHLSSSDMEFEPFFCCVSGQGTKLCLGFDCGDEVWA